MVRSRARLTSAGSTAYNQETLVIPLSAKPNHAAVLMATTIPCKIHIPLRLPRPLNPNKTASKQNRAARQLRTCRWSRRPLNLSPFALAQISGGHATKSPLSELVARGSVQRRFLQRLRGSALALDYNHGVAETSPFCELIRDRVSFPHWRAMKSGIPVSIPIPPGAKGDQELPSPS